MAETGQDIALAAKYLQQGELVAIPTETVYGLAGNALDAEAVALIFETKNRPHFDPLIVHTHSLTHVHRFVSSFPDKLLRLAEAFWPGPLTLLLPKQAAVPDLVTSGLARVAVRVPRHPLTLALLEQLDFPLAAPSANPFGYISPTTPQHVQAQLGENIPYILDGGRCEVGLESTIVGMEDGELVVYRLGGMDLAEIEAVAGKATVKTSSSNPEAPGLLESHYAPAKPMILGNLQELVKQYLHDKKKIAVLSFSTIFPDVDAADQFALSPDGDLREAAKNLFAAMRSLDEGRADIILAELLPETGLGRAINDRLRRAAARR